MSERLAQLFCNQLRIIRCRLTTYSTVQYSTVIYERTNPEAGENSPKAGIRTNWRACFIVGRLNLAAQGHGGLSRKWHVKMAPLWVAREGAVQRSAVQSTVSTSG